MAKIRILLLLTVRSYRTTLDQVIARSGARQAIAHLVTSAHGQPAIPQRTAHGGARLAVSLEAQLLAQRAKVKEKAGKAKMAKTEPGHPLQPNPKGGGLEKGKIAVVALLLRRKLHDHLLLLLKRSEAPRPLEIKTSLLASGGLRAPALTVRTVPGGTRHLANIFKRGIALKARIANSSTILKRLRQRSQRQKPA